MSLFIFPTPFYSVVIVVALLIVLYILKFNKTGSLYRTGATSELSRFCVDLTGKAQRGELDPVIGRQDEINRVIQVLSRRTKNNPVLVGKPGVGKTAIAEGLAQAIVDKKVPSSLNNKKVLALDLPSIIAGTKYRGEFEKRLKDVADEIKASNRQIILFIDEIHTLAEAGESSGGIDADDILKPALARGDLQVVGATTAPEYQRYIKKDPTLDRRLHPILIDEPTQQEAIDILKGIKRKYELFHNVIISDQAIESAVKLSAKYIKDASFPDKAIDLMDEAASKVTITALNAKHKGLPTVKPSDIKAVLTERMEDVTS